MKKFLIVLGISVVIIALFFYFFASELGREQKLNEDYPLPVNISGDFFIDYGVGADIYIYKKQLDSDIYNNQFGANTYFAFNSTQNFFFSHSGKYIILYINQIPYRGEMPEDVYFKYGNIPFSAFSPAKKWLGLDSYDAFCLFDTNSSRLLTFKTYSQLIKYCDDNNIKQDTWYGINQFYYFEASKQMEKLK